MQPALAGFNDAWVNTMEPALQSFLRDRGFDLDSRFPQRPGEGASVSIRTVLDTNPPDGSSVLLDPYDKPSSIELNFGTRKCTRALWAKRMKYSTTQLSMMMAPGSVEIAAEIIADQILGDRQAAFVSAFTDTVISTKSNVGYRWDRDGQTIPIHAKPVPVPDQWKPEPWGAQPWELPLTYGKLQHAVMMIESQGHRPPHYLFAPRTAVTQIKSDPYLRNRDVAYPAQVDVTTDMATMIPELGLQIVPILGIKPMVSIMAGKEVDPTAHTICPADYMIQPAYLVGRTAMEQRIFEPLSSQLIPVPEYRNLYSLVIGMDGGFIRLSDNGVVLIECYNNMISAKPDLPVEIPLVADPERRRA